jgi:hypothetical protein
MDDKNHIVSTVHISNALIGICNLYDMGLWRYDSKAFDTIVNSIRSVKRVTADPNQYFLSDEEGEMVFMILADISDWRKQSTNNSHDYGLGNE